MFKEYVMIRFNAVEKACLAEILSEQLAAECGLIIGKADKRYTLWKYRKEEDKKGSYIEMSYMHVLSPKRNKVEQRFPGVYICEELRGLTGGSKSVRVQVKSKASAPKTLADYVGLPFGQFRGIPFREVTDASYWCWLANKSCLWNDNGTEIDFRSIVEERCKDLGCTQMFGRWYAPASENDRPWIVIARDILPKIERGEEFSFVPESNACCWWFGIDIIFKPEDTYSFYTYYGCGHYLVVTDKKGNKKNKRAKGKTVLIKEYSLNQKEDGTYYVLVEKFELK